MKLRGPVAALALAVLAASCRPRAPEMRDAGSDAHPAEAASRAPLRPGARPDAGARAAAPGSPTPDRDAGTTFLHALARGRAATTRKDFPAALAAFDEALGKVPREPRALAERGYAKLLAGDVYGAGMDLRAARGRTTDEALSAQIWWNLGLWGEKAGNAAFAHEAFAHAYALRPSRAGRAKLGDAGTCAATLDRERVKLEHHATWPTGWEDVRATCGAACLTTAKPVDAGDDPEHDAAGDVPHHLVIPAPGGGYDVIEAISSGTTLPLPCGARLVQATVVDERDPLEVQVTRIGDVAPVVDYVVDDAGETQMNGPHCAGGGGGERLEVFVDRRTGERVLLVRQDVDGPEAVVVKKGGGVALAGAGCDETVPFGAPVTTSHDAR